MPHERKCKQCGNNGHNSRTCTGCKKFKLFGVQIDVPDVRMRKCNSTGNLKADEDTVDEAFDYTSDGVPGRHGRKKGKPWTSDEHRAFLAGLEKIGKGDWKGVSENFVPSRTSTQVASHAQKYFIRLAAQQKKHRRTSVFDIRLKEKEEENQQPQIGSTSVSKSDEKSQEGGNLTVPTKTIGELNAQKDIRAPVAAFLRPPPPMTIWKESDLQYMAYLRDLYTQGSIQRFVPTRLLQVQCPVSYFSAPNIQPCVTKMLQSGSSQNSSTNYKNYFVSEIPPNFGFVESPLQQAQNKNEVNLSIRNLAI